MKLDLDHQAVVIVDAVRAVLLALVALGWVTLDDAQIAAVITAVGAMLLVGGSVLTWHKVYAKASVDLVEEAVQEGPPE